MLISSLYWHSPFFRCILDCQIDHFLAESSIGNSLRFLMALRMTLLIDSMTHTNNPIIKHKVGLLNLASELNC
jgi:hypothetical protein